MIPDQENIEAGLIEIHAARQAREKAMADLRNLQSVVLQVLCFLRTGEGDSNGLASDLLEEALVDAGVTIPEHCR